MRYGIRLFSLESRGNSLDSLFGPEGVVSVNVSAITLNRISSPVECFYILSGIINTKDNNCLYRNP